jgi:hypothetical protein
VAPDSPSVNAAGADIETERASLFSYRYIDPDRVAINGIGEQALERQ